jgi:hypothetical protein
MLSVNNEELPMYATIFILTNDCTFLFGSWMKNLKYPKFKSLK